MRRGGAFAHQIAPIHTYHLPSLWTQPHDFDPERFSLERAEHRRHAYAYLPFGGGAHLCIGQHFADMEVKGVMRQVLRRFAWQVRDGCRMPYRLVPIAKPRDGLPIELRPLETEVPRSWVRCCACCAG